MLRSVADKGAHTVQTSCVHTYGVSPCMVQMADFDTALHLEEQHKAEGQADGYR